MSFDTTQLFIGLIFGSIGVGYSIYGKRQQHKVVFYTGLALMFYPYFISNNFALILTGIALMLVPRFVSLP